MDPEQTPFTPAVSNFYALEAAVDELLWAGVDQRIRTYERRNRWIRDELRAMGFEFFSNYGCESRTILCIQVPQGVSYDDLYRGMRRRGYIIYGCKNHLKDRFFQVANMGELTDEQVECFLGVLRMVLADLRRRNQDREMGSSIQTELLTEEDLRPSLRR
jgi:aspartate aminotransferase-like enzyme